MLAITSNVKRVFHQYETAVMNATIERVLGPVSPTVQVLLEERNVVLKMNVCMVCMALMTNTVLYAKSWDSFVSVSAWGQWRN